MEGFCSEVSVDVMQQVIQLADYSVGKMYPSGCGCVGGCVEAGL